MHSQGNKYLPNKLIGVSKEVKQVQEQIDKLISVNENVLIYGEPGTETLLVARTILQKIQSRNLPCLEIKGDQLEGALETWLAAWPVPTMTASAANSALLLIDGLEALSRAGQQQLWMLLNEKPQNRLLRGLSTAWYDMSGMLSRNDFRQDLFQALSIHSLRLPALRERKEDVPMMFEFFLNRACDHLRLPIPTVPFDLIMSLLSHDWPGNLIELESCVCEFLLQANVVARDRADEWLAKPAEGKIQPLPAAMEELERTLIQQALAQFNGSQRKTAAALGLSEPNLRYRIKKLGLNKKMVYSY